MHPIYRNLFHSALWQHGQRVAAGSASIPTPTPPPPETFRYLFSAPDAADKLFIHFNDDDRVSYR